MKNKIQDVDDLLLGIKNVELINKVNKLCINKCHIDLLKLHEEDIECLEICSDNDARYRLVQLQNSN